MAQQTCLADLAPNPRNPRKITDDKLAQLKKSLDKFGDLSGVVFNVRSGQLVGGHQRVKVLPQGAQVVVSRAHEVATPAGTVREGHVVVDGERFAYREVDWDDATEKAANLAANQGAGTFDMPAVSEWLTELDDAGFDLDLTMFGAEERDAVMPETEQVAADMDIDEQLESAPPLEPNTRPGDIYSLGGHKLMCGDSTNVGHIESLMNGEIANMVYTDPPYGMHLDTDYSKIKGSKNSKLSSKYAGKKHRRVLGDHQDFSADLINSIFAMFSHVKEIFLWGADYYSELLPQKNDGSWVVWDKRLDEQSDKMVGSCFELCWSKSKHKREICRLRWAGVFGIEEARNRVHPTQKPTPLAEWFFSRWGSDGDLVVDLYGGSGSTMLACEKQNRRCYMMELDPGYCDVILSRWEKLTGQKAERIPSDGAAADDRQSI